MAGDIWQLPSAGLTKRHRLSADSAVMAVHRVDCCVVRVNLNYMSSLEEPSPFPVACVSAQPGDEDLSDVVAQRVTHVETPDYPEGKSALHQLLVQSRHAVALPGEPLRLTNRVTHTISLQPVAKPFYVPSYRLPPTQLPVVLVVDELLPAGVPLSPSLLVKLGMAYLFT